MRLHGTGYVVEYDDGVGGYKERSYKEFRRLVHKLAVKVALEAMRCAAREKVEEQAASELAARRGQAVREQAVAKSVEQAVA